MAGADLLQSGFCYFGVPSAFLAVSIPTCDMFVVDTLPQVIVAHGFYLLPYNLPRYPAFSDPYTHGPVPWVASPACEVPPVSPCPYADSTKASRQHRQ